MIESEFLHKKDVCDYYHTVSTSPKPIYRNPWGIGSKYAYAYSDVCAICGQKIERVMSKEEFLGGLKRND